MNLSLIRSMTRSAVFELENGLCFRPAHPFTVTLNGETIYDPCSTNVFSLFSLLLSLIHISEPTRRTPISYAVFCLKKKNNTS